MLSHSLIVSRGPSVRRRLGNARKRRALAVGADHLRWIQSWDFLALCDAVFGHYQLVGREAPFQQQTGPREAVGKF